MIVAFLSGVFTGVVLLTAAQIVLKLVTPHFTPLPEPPDHKSTLELFNEARPKQPPRKKSVAQILDEVR